MCHIKEIQNLKSKILNNNNTCRNLEQEFKKVSGESRTQKIKYTLACIKNALNEWDYIKSTIDSKDNLNNAFCLENDEIEDFITFYELRK